LLRIFLGSEKYEATLALAGGWSPRPDPHGWVTSYKAQALYCLNRLEDAAIVIEQAISLAGAQPPLVFHLLKARILLAKGETAKALAAWKLGLKEDERSHAGDWYNRGVVESALARSSSSPSLLRSALVSFRTAARLDNKDIDARIAEAALRLEFGEESEGIIACREALRLLGDQGDAPRIRRAKGLLGSMLYRQASVQSSLDGLRESVQYLRAAWTSEVKAGEGKDAAVAANLFAADLGIAHLGNEPQEIKKILPELEKILGVLGESPFSGELLAAQRYHLSRSLMDAGDLNTALEKASQGLTLLGPRIGQNATLSRHLLAGHLNSILADADQANETKHVTDALKEYLAAVNLGSFPAREHYLAQSRRLSGVPALEAAWQVLIWRRFLSFEAWSLVLVTYGKSELWKTTLHLTIWGLIAFCCLLGWILGMLPKKTQSKVPIRTVDDTHETERASAGVRQSGISASGRKQPAQETRRPSPKTPPVQPRSETPRASPALRPSTEKSGKQKSSESVRKPASEKTEKKETDNKNAPKAPPGLSERGALGDIARRIAQEQEKRRK
jgi:tetratricopeptide (TPR) repeat protein